MPGVDNTGFEDDLLMQWREFFQIFVFPFYSIEYAFAQLGAVQIWQNYQQEPRKTIDRFCEALGHGNTINVPDFYTLAGAKFSVDVKTLKQAMGAFKKALLI